MISFSIYIIVLNILYIRGFNIDLNHAIIFTDESSNYYRSSYYGYTVILYSDAYNASETWVQIGSPRGNISGYNIVEPGVVYRCNIFGPCTVIPLEKISKLHDYEQNPSTVLMGGAWLGGAMDINPQSGRVAICGFRWKYYEDHIPRTAPMNLMHGVCYWSLVNDTKNIKKLIPLNNLSKAVQVLQDRSGRKNPYFYYGLGEAGICAHFSNSHEQPPELLLGAPGVYNWIGTAIIYRDGVSDIPVASRLMQYNSNKRHQRAISYSAFKLDNIANSIETPETTTFELFGYSATSGYFFEKDELLYASGSPRHNYRGQVLIFKFANKSDKALVVITILKSEELGEYFGASLTAGDINQDGLDDLIVGAPYYSGSTYNQGRIYIFFGTSKRKFDLPQLNPIIVGESPRAQFGLSLMYLDNFNNDGFKSVAVGAPYENNHTGAVYIYRGSQIGLQTVPSQKILGSNFSSSIKGFGISISKPTDIDRNFYNDLAIGAYISKHVVILRSKPVITIQQSLTRLTPNLDYTSKDFQINSCFWYNDYQAPPTINITRKISVDELLLRAYLDENIPLIDNVTLTYNVTYCHIIKVYIKEETNNKNDSMTVTVTPELILHYDTKNLIFSTHRENLTHLDTFCKDCPISNPYFSTKGKTIDFDFTLNCGADDVCDANLQLESKFINIQRDNYVLGSTDDLNFQLTVKNFGEYAYQTQAIIELPNSVYFGKISSFCSDHNSSSAVICDIGNPLVKFEPKSVNLTLDMRKVDTIKYGDIFHFNMTLKTTSRNLHRSNQIIKSLTISREADIAITGAAGQQSYLLDNSINSTIPNLIHTFQIEKYGASPIEEVVLTISVPTRIFSQTKYTRFAGFYEPVAMHGNLPTMSCTNTEKYLSDDLQEIAEFGLDTVNDSKNNISSYENQDAGLTRRKRSVDYGTENTENVLQNNEIMSEVGYARNRVFAINCSDENIICSTITCIIGPFTKKHNVAKIELKIRLNETVLLSELLGNKDIIALSTQGKVVIKSPENFIQTGSREDEVRILSVVIIEKPETTIESWIIIIAVIVGLLLLCLLILGLVKAGFFKRRVKQELKALKELEGVEQSKRSEESDGEDNMDEIMEKENAKK